jgi:hypothetical protein
VRRESCTMERNVGFGRRGHAPAAEAHFREEYWSPCKTTEVKIHD